MNCWLCNAPISDTRLVATTYHFWMRLCPACTERVGSRDASGQLIYQAEQKHVQ